jgi:HEAT repeat protein
VRKIAHLLLIAASLVLAGGLRAQQPGSSASAAAKLIEQERMRQRVEEAFNTYIQPADEGAVRTENLVKAADLLVDAGPAAVPFLTNELEQSLPGTFYLCAYALGRLNTPEAESALRQAVEKAESERGDWPAYRKAWALFSLGLMGKADVIDLVNDGNHVVGGFPVHRGWSTIETIALHTYPECLPLLLSQLDILAEDPEMIGERIRILRALWRLSHPSTVSKLKELAKDPDFRIRSGAVRALGAIDTPEATAAALAALDDEDASVRKQAAWSLQRHLPEVQLSVILEKLGSEEDSGVRRSLYKLLIQRGGRNMLEALAGQWGRQDGTDRANLLQAIGSIGGEEAVEILGRGLYDPQGRVVASAAEQLAKIGGDEAIDLLIEGMRSPRWVVAQECARQLRELRVKRAAPAVAARLLNVELVTTLKDPARRYRIELLCDTLVAADYHQVLDDLRKKKELQIDPMLISLLNDALLRLETIKKNGRKAKLWIDTMKSREEPLRLLAYDRLGRIGGAKVARELAASFGRVEQDEGVAILKALGGIPGEHSMELVERVLLAPEFDGYERSYLRSEAAWSARRIGGDRMFNALKASAERRQGRDAEVLIYLAVLGGDKALAILREYRMPRMVYLGLERGEELETIDWIIDQLEHGRSIASLDLPPDSLLLT